MIGNAWGPVGRGAIERHRVRLENARANGVADTAEGQRVFKALADGGQVAMPFEKTFWSEGFGMVTDRFGTPWMVNVAHK